MTELVPFKGKIYDNIDDLFHAMCEEERAKEGGADQVSLRPGDYSDAGNAEVFIREYKGSLIFVDALGWLAWDGQKWDRSDHHALGMAVEFSARMWLEALAVYDKARQAEKEADVKYQETGSEEDKKALETVREETVKRAKDFLGHARRLRGEVQIRHMIALARPFLNRQADTLDANPYDLNTPAGIVDLRTGKIRPHDPLAFCTKVTGCAPGEQGRKQWYDFLDVITCGDRSLEGYIQMVSGMSSIGEVLCEAMQIATGSGKNGKSTMFNVLFRALGEYAGTIDIDILTTSRNNSKGAALATLRGKRMVLAGELEEHQRLSVSMLKRIASTDMLTVEEKYKQPETVKPSHTVVMFTNFLPRVSSRDKGTWRRILVIPFNAVISESRDVKNYAEVLFQEAGPAVMAWIIEGAVNFLRNGCRLDPPESVLEATEAYKQQEDWLANFIADRCTIGPNRRVARSVLYNAYSIWCDENGEYKLSSRDFYRGVYGAGYELTKSNGIRIVRGLDLSAGQVEAS